MATVSLLPATGAALARPFMLEERLVLVGQRLKDNVCYPVLGEITPPFAPPSPEHHPPRYRGNGLFSPVYVPKYIDWTMSPTVYSNP